MGNIKHWKDGDDGMFYYEDDRKKLAEMTYFMRNDQLMVIDHTEVDPSLKGQGIGKKLQAELVEYVRANNIKVFAVCPFAKATFEKTPEWGDVLAKGSS